MNIQQIVTSKKFKNFMAKVYGWGAAIVILGAMFKIQHWPGAAVMLVGGLTTEAFIFFMSAFEPPHAEPDWSLVYPELAGMYDLDDDLQGGKIIKTPTEELDDMLAEAKIGPELIASLGVGLQKMSDNASKLGEMSDAFGATNGYVANIQKASAGAAELTESYHKTSAELVKDLNAGNEYVDSVRAASQSANTLSEAYNQTAQALRTDLNASEEYTSSLRNATSSANALNEKYVQSAEALTRSTQSLGSITIEGSDYKEKVGEVARNLGALNAVYELQIQSSNEQLETTKRLQDGMQQFIENLNESVANTSRYKEESSALVKNIAALNNVYGNMLTAMNVSVK